MKAVVIGGHARDIGKTRVAETLLRSLKGLAWAAVKISAHAHPSAEDRSGFTLRRECAPSMRTDTGRYLAAGARRALWLSVPPGRIEEALPALREALADEQFVLMESNTILEHLRPAAFLFVLNPARHEFKPSARLRLHRADAFVLVQGELDAAAWPAVNTKALRRKPCFCLPPHRHVCPELRRFIFRRLESAPDSQLY